MILFRDIKGYKKIVKRITINPKSSMINIIYVYLHRIAD